MICKEFDFLIDCYLHGDISEEDRETFEEHYFTCDECFTKLKINERLHKKGFRVVLKGKKPLFILKPILVLSSIFVLVISSIIFINGVNRSRVMNELSKFSPPIFVPIETRNVSTQEKFFLAMKHYKNKEYNQALQILENIELQSDNPQVTFFTGICYLINDNPRTAIKKFDIIIKDMNPSYYDEAIYYKGKALLKLKKKKAAMEQFENLSKMFSPYASRAKSILKELN